MTVKQQVGRTLYVCGSVAVAGALMALGWFGDSTVAASLGAALFVVTVLITLAATVPDDDPWPDSVAVVEFKRRQLRATLREARAKRKEAA